MKQKVDWNEKDNLKLELISIQVACQLDQVFNFQVDNNNTTHTPFMRVHPSRNVMKDHFLKHLDLHYALNECNLWVFIILPNDETGWYAYGTTETQIKIKKYLSSCLSTIDSELLRVDMMDEDKRMMQIAKEQKEWNDFLNKRGF